MEEKPKKKFTQSRLFIFLVTYLSLAVIITPIALDMGNGKLHVIGDFFMGGGVVVVVLGFLFMDRNTHRKDPPSYSTYLSSPEDFKRMRAHQKPFERVLFMIIFAGVAIALTGFLWNTFLFPVPPI